MPVVLKTELQIFVVLEKKIIVCMVYHKTQNKDRREEQQMEDNTETSGGWHVRGPCLRIEAHVMMPQPLQVAP